MKMKPIRKVSSAWVEDNPDVKPVAGYEEAVHAAIAKGKAQLDAGQGIPAAQVWDELGIE